MRKLSTASAFVNPDEEAIVKLLRAVRVIAVVGLSPKEGRPSFRVAQAMQGFGYRIIPVRPAVESVLGEKAYARLEDVPEKIDLVDVFRAPEHIEPIVDSCLALGIKHLWLQDGVVNEAAARRARAAGIEVVMDRCVYRDYVRLVAPRL
jgi:predicted CoA-binding protein